MVHVGRKEAMAFGICVHLDIGQFGGAKLWDERNLRKRVKVFKQLRQHNWGGCSCESNIGAPRRACFALRSNLRWSRYEGGVRFGCLEYPAGCHWSSMGRCYREVGSWVALWR